jgi:hypothetical protein
MNNLYEKLRSENDNHFYSFIFGDFDFKNITKKNIYSVGSSNIVKIFGKTINNKTIVININVPYYKKYHPEKLEATSFGFLGIPIEYNKIDKHISNEINIISFKQKFINGLIEIYNQL